MKNNENNYQTPTISNKSMSSSFKNSIYQHFGNKSPLLEGEPIERNEDSMYINIIDDHEKVNDNTLKSLLK